MNHVGSMCFHWGKCLTSSLKRLSHGWWIAIFGLKPRPEKSPAIGTTCGMWSLNYRMFLMVPITLSGFGRMLQTTSKIKTSLWYASEVFWMTKPTPSISAFLWCCAERILDPSFSFFLIPWEKMDGNHSVHVLLWVLQIWLRKWAVVMKPCMPTWSPPLCRTQYPERVKWSALRRLCLQFGWNPDSNIRPCLDPNTAAFYLPCRVVIISQWNFNIPHQT